MLERLQKEMVKALKEGNKFRKLTLSTLISAVKKAGIDAGCRENIPDEMVIQVLKKEKKNLVDTVEKFPDMPVEKKSEYIDEQKYKVLDRKCSTIRFLLVKSITTAKSNLNKSK
jgi:hypothetical protein